MLSKVVCSIPRAPAITPAPATFTKPITATFKQIFDVRLSLTSAVPQLEVTIETPQCYLRSITERPLVDYSDRVAHASLYRDLREGDERCAMAKYGERRKRDPEFVRRVVDDSLWNWRHNVPKGVFSIVRKQQTTTAASSPPSSSRFLTVENEEERAHFEAMGLPVGGFVPTPEFKSAFVGSIVLEAGSCPGEAELAALSFGSHWGKGFMNEAATAMCLVFAPAVVALGFQEYSNGKCEAPTPLLRLFATSSADNPGSYKILDRLGFTHFASVATSASPRQFRTPEELAALVPEQQQQPKKNLWDVTSQRLRTCQRHAKWAGVKFFLEKDISSLQQLSFDELLQQEGMKYHWDEQVSEEVKVVTHTFTKQVTLERHAGAATSNLTDQK